MPVIPEIKNVISPDIDLATFQPEEPDNFLFLLEYIIGISGKDGGDIFQIIVWTPKWLLKNYGKEDTLYCSHRLIVFEYDIDRILKKIENRIVSCQGNNWQEVALQLSKFAHWEFDDYH